MATKTIRNSIHIEAETFGGPCNPQVLLISGAGAPAGFWPEEFCRQLAKDSLFVIRYSHRDTGLSDHFHEPYPIDELLQDMMELVASFGLGRVHLVGHSMGGYLAQLAMCRHPERVLTATSISAGSTVVPEAMRRLGMSAPAEATWQVLWNNKPTGDFERDLPGWLSVWRFLNGVCPFDEELAIRYTRALYVGDSCNAQFAVNHIHAVSTLPVSLEQDIRCAETPLLVIHGTKDPLVPPDNGEATARLARYSRIHLLQGAGHMFFHIDIWREICKVLLTHIRQDLSGRCTPTALTGCQ